MRLTHRGGLRKTSDWADEGYSRYFRVGFPVSNDPPGGTSYYS